MHTNTYGENTWFFEFISRSITFAKPSLYFLNVPSTLPCQSIQSTDTTSILPLAPLPLFQQRKMSNLSQRLMNERNEKERAAIQDILYDPPTIEDRPIDATYVYPTGNFILVDRELKPECVVQRAVTANELDKLAFKTRNARRTENVQRNLNYPSSSVQLLTVANEQEKVVKKAVEWIFKLLRERLQEKMLLVQHEKYFPVHEVTKGDIERALSDYAEVNGPQFDGDFLDGFVAQLLTEVEYGDHCCEVCGMVFDDKEGLNDHKESRFRTPFVCIELGCGRRLCTVDAVKLHCELIHGRNAEDGKPVIDMEMEDRCENIVRSQAQENVKGEVCDEEGCCRWFRSRRGLATHKRLAHKRRS